MALFFMVPVGKYGYIEAAACGNMFQMTQSGHIFFLPSRYDNIYQHAVSTSFTLIDNN